MYCKCGYVCGEGFNDCYLKSCKQFRINKQHFVNFLPMHINALILRNCQVYSTCIGNLQINNRGDRFFSSFIFDDTLFKEKFSQTGLNNINLSDHFPL